MKLASLRPGGREGGGRDGTLVVVDGALTRCRRVPEIAGTLQAALEDWTRAAPALEAVAAALEAGEGESEPFAPERCAAPLPRAYQFADGSAYLNHVELVRKARGAELPDTLRSDPLMYQGLSDHFLGPTEDAAFGQEDWGIDFEAEIAVILGDVAMGAGEAEARAAIRLVVLLNDWSLRNLVPGELAKGFGFFQSKPASALSPVAVTPEALGEAWDGGRLGLPLRSSVNGDLVGAPDAGVDLAFDFGVLVAHAARTRRLMAGTVIGSGTISNRDPAAGISCLAEARMREILAGGQAQTGFLRFGDRVTIEMLDAAGRSLFGAIDQRVVEASSST